MAAAVAGIAEFVQGEEPVDVVRQVLETSGGMIHGLDSSLAILLLGSLLGSRLHPLVQQERSNAAAQGAPAELLERVRVDVTFGGFVANEAVLVSYRIDQGLSSTRSIGALHPPHTVKDFCTTGRYATEEQRFGHSLQGPDAVAAHVHDLLQECIAEECRRNGRNIKIGGGVDVVLVERTGARAWWRSDAMQS